MNFCVLVKISRRMVSFWYQSEGSSYTPLVIKDANEIPLFFYVNGNDFIFGDAARDRFFSNDPNAFGNYFEIIKDPSIHFTISGNKKPVKQLFYYGIEKYLSHFINTVLYKSDSIETYRNLFPLRFIFEPDIEEKEKLLVEGLFSDAGYVNLERIDYNESLFEVLQKGEVINKSNSVVKLTGIDNNLYLELYKTLSGNLTSYTKIEEHGSDPRVKILADMIIEYIALQNPHLTINKEVEIATILPYSSNLLHNISPIIKGDAILSDGKPYYFMVKERNLNERLLFLSNDNIIYTAIDDLLKTYSLNVENTFILLASEEINTIYFSNKLLKKYPNVKGIEIAHDLDTMKLIFSKIAESGYFAKRIIPDAPPVLPGRNIAPISTDVIKPNLPPISKKGPEIPSGKSPPLLPPDNSILKNKDEVINKPPLPNNNSLNMFIGKLGIVTSILSPTGKIEIDKVEYEAISEKNELDKGIKVKVIGVSAKKYLQVEKVVLPPLPPKKKIILTNQLN